MANIKTNISIKNTMSKKPDKDFFLYYRDKKRQIVPFPDNNKQKMAKERLKELFFEFSDDLPKKFKDNWTNVKLFNPAGDVDNAHAIILKLEDGSYDLNNKLNYLTGKEWTMFSCSWFIFNALKKDLDEERRICENSIDHPATYSPTMMEGFIKFFTKEGMSVLDPFAGIGSTLVGCARTNRIGYGIELNKKYCRIIIKRVPEFKANVICGDAVKVKKYFGNNKKFDFSISSPPYWNVLNRSTKDFKAKRVNGGLDVNYSDDKADLGNIDDYNFFLEKLAGIYFDIYDLLKDGAYITIIVKNVKKEGKIYPLAWDLAHILSKKYELKDEKIWIQDKVGLAPYGYPSAWASNILHHYCLIFKKT
ncbi:MAG: site-specific DNA-methyltransferase [Deltaproteobacteria bacterium]|jgi:DNA modification methylase|nr:site-specific DNA-methyltransferase [Deltaproteobacteria bacterium]